MGALDQEHTPSECQRNASDNVQESKRYLIYRKNCRNTEEIVERKHKKQMDQFYKVFNAHAGLTTVTV